MKRPTSPTHLVSWATCACLVATAWAQPRAPASFWTSRLDRLENAPFAPVDGAPQVLVQRPTEARATVDVVLHLHGYEGCVEVLAAEGPARCRPGARTARGWDLAGAHREIEVPTWFVLPQLAFHRRDGSPGRLARSGAARRFIDEVLHRTAQERGEPTPTLGTLVLTAHSAGFEALVAIVRHGGLGSSLRHIVLFDALYSGVPVFAEWALADPSRSLVSFHTAGGTPARRAAEFVERYGRRLGSRLRTGPDLTERAIAPGFVVLLRARTSHRDVPRRHLANAVSRLLAPREQ